MDTKKVDKLITEFINEMSSEGLVTYVAVSEVTPDSKEGFTTAITTAFKTPTDSQLISSPKGIGTMEVINSLEGRGIFRQSNLLLVIESIISKHLNPAAVGKGFLEVMVNGIFQGIYEQASNYSESNELNELKVMAMLAAESDPEGLKKSIASKLMRDLTKSYEREYL